MIGATEMDLSGQHVVVVGGGSGIGRATAKRAVELGAHVTVSGRTAVKLDSVASEIGDRATAIPMDMTDETSVRQWAGQLERVDHLIISASSAVHGPFAETETVAIRGMIESKFLGPIVTIRETLPKMNESGSIVLFAGVLSRRPGKGAVALGAVNAGVEGLTRGLALELGPKVRVNCISPGMTDTEAYAHLPAERRAAMYKDTASRLPLGRIGEAEEVAAAAIYAATATFLTGHILDVDGGHMVRQ